MSWGGKEVHPPRKYFAETTELVLGLGTDGIPLFKKSPVDCWPLLVTNYTLPDHLRTHKDNMICCGLIPGQYKAPLCVYADKFKYLVSLR